MRIINKDKKEIYKISEKYTDMPGGRYIKNGKHSGEDFREQILMPKIMKHLKNNSRLVIDLDGSFGYPRSFLEESFGGLARSKKISKEDIYKTLSIISNDEPNLISLINKYIKGENDE